MKLKPTSTHRLFALALLFFAQLAAGQQVREIVLYVDTGNIQNPNVNDFCNFGQPADISNEDFTTDANVGDTIVWRGVSSTNPDDQVLIESINHEGDKGGREIFGQNVLPGENGMVQGVVRNSTAGGPPYKYKITFRVLNNDEPRQGVYNIDPKIRVN
jgi:hypothetical protein